MITQGSRICFRAIDAVGLSIFRPSSHYMPVAARRFGTTTEALGSSQAQPGSLNSSPKAEQKQKSDSSVSNHKQDEPKPAKQKKTMAQLDDEMMKKMSAIAGDGGSAGVEYEDGQPVSMKRSVKNNMFRYI
ncbi:hypothetical protein PG993_002916 [Apiospora rasikravindrae]|uniref:Uncharacterized protein n=1 Tax=Apiospora rasikravindrae TaxID=990691 RepID=A0ABR1U064_9PEZI